METENQKLRKRVEALSKETMVLAHTVTELTAKLKLATSAAPQPVDVAQAVPEAGVTDPIRATWPQRIYLQSENEHGDGADPFNHRHEITWCQDQIGSFDIEYVRADLAATPSPAAQPAAQGEVPEGAGPFTLEQRMPPKDVEVLIFWPCSDGTFGCRVDEWLELYEDPIGMGGPTICTGEGWASHYDQNVTHWAPIPLPAAPQPTDTTAGE